MTFPVTLTQGQGQRSNNVFSCKCISVKVKDQIMYFLVNASPHKLFEVATSNFACA